MVARNWYDPAQHQRHESAPDYHQVPASDVGGLLTAYEQRQRERHVKLAHFHLVQEEMQRCYLRWGVHSFQQHCRHLIEEFRQTKDELMGWKEGHRMTENIPWADQHFSRPNYGPHTPPSTSSSTSTPTA